jgi:hypothetical protein
MTQSDMVKYYNSGLFIFDCPLRYSLMFIYHKCQSIRPISVNKLPIIYVFILVVYYYMFIMSFDIGSN